MDPERGPLVDPLVFRLGGLEEGATLFVINRRTHLNGRIDNPNDRIQLPWSGHPDADGFANLVLGDKALFGIRGNDVLSVFAVDTAGNVSPPCTVAINPVGPSERIRNPIGRGSVEYVCEHPSVVREDFITTPDRYGPSVEPSVICTSVRMDRGRSEITITGQKDAYAIEPFATVYVDRPPFRTGHYPVRVRGDGTFEFKASDVEHGDAVVLRVQDHSTHTGQQALNARGRESGPPRTERRVVLTAGAHGGVVVDNPQLGTRSALEAAPGRITLGPGHIQGALGSATPGAIVYIYNQTLGRGWTTGVSHDGSFARNLPVAPGDVVSIRLLDAFDEENRRVDLGATSVPCRATALSGCTRPR